MARHITIISLLLFILIGLYMVQHNLSLKINELENLINSKEPVIINDNY